MKRIISLIVLALLSLSVFADTYRILKLSPSPVVIGGVSKKVQDTFTDQQEIKWQYESQGMWVADLTNGGYRYFSKEAFDQKNVKNVYSYLKTNHPSTRDGYNWKSVQSAAYDNEKRLALVIGNSNYVNEMSLRNPIADATEISNRLRRLGFDVMVMYDASKKDMEQALQYFRSAAYNQKYGTVLFYYAGHGLQYADKPFLIPSDAKVFTGDHVKENCISGGEIVSYMNETQAETKIAIFDACRSEKTFLRGARSDFKMDGLENGIIIFSTKGGYPANDGGSNHSPFAEALLNHMSTPDLGASELLSRVISDVKKSTKDFIEPQVPNMTHFSLDHSFYFTKKVETAPATIKTTNSTAGKADVPSKPATASASVKTGASASQDAPMIKVSGKVFDDSGEPVVGATVVCPKTNTATITFPDGDYLITVPQGETLKIFEIGYEEVTLTASASKLPDVVLREIKSPKTKELTGTLNGHEWVDLGLPSGLKWATCNIGASSPEGNGSYYAWGETARKSKYDWDTYKWCNGTQESLTKYNYDSSLGLVDNKYRLELSDDAARKNWGSTWRLPTLEEFIELKKNCTVEWTSQNGKIGLKYISKANGKSIFLPAGGWSNISNVFWNDHNGNYMTSTLCTESPCVGMLCRIYSRGAFEDGLIRCYGISVRPVTE